MKGTVTPFPFVQDDGDDYRPIGSFYYRVLYGFASSSIEDRFFMHAQAICVAVNCFSAKYFCHTLIHKCSVPELYT